MSNNGAAVLPFEDLTKEYAAGYSDKLAKALKQRVLTAVHAYEEGDDVRYATTTYFGLKAKKEYTADMMQKLISAVEDLVERGYVKGFLRGFSRLELDENECAVIIYPALTDEGVEYAKSAYANFIKGV